MGNNNENDGINNLIGLIMHEVTFLMDKFHSSQISQVRQPYQTRQVKITYQLNC